MCGICGSVNIDKSWVEQTLELQHMRGPDYRGIQTIGNVTFGHNRLAIIDLSKNGNQPYYGEVDMLTYNGEIYNYQSIVRFHELSDTSLLYDLLEVGVDYALDRINGMYAFGYFNSLSNELHLAVDRFAQKPLYYYHEGDKFAFASTPAALYVLKYKWELDRDALQSYWLLGSVMGSDSLFKGIKKLCTSEHLTYDIKANTVKVERYWEPKYVQCSVPDLGDMVIDAIRKVKVSDVPINIFLSGGIDSTLVASEFRGGKAIHLDGPERQYAQFVADKFDIDLKVITPQESDVEECLTDYVRKCGEPTMAGIIPYIVSRETAKHGKVAISANGADELFFGYDRTSEKTTLKQRNHIYRGSLGCNTITYDESKFVSNSWLALNGRLMELDTYVQFDLNKTLDFASMCHGLEVRSPFLDHRLVEMALSISESEHRKHGNKTILKDILRKLGFADNFLNRPKQGFSLFSKPKNIDYWIPIAWKFAHDEGFLDVDKKKLSDRDSQYLRMSALGFYFWYQEWKHKLR